MGRTPLIRRLLTVAGVALVSLVVLEAVLVLLRRVPPLAVPPLTEIARKLYLLDRRMIQFEGAAARWDPDLGYTLRPGRFVFANTEYETSYLVNSAGVRDDEASLTAPEIVVAGDSFALGWGVEQPEAFPDRLEALSGRSVLNTAVASYGTARQLRLLSRLDLSAASHLVIQFCNNDYFENLAFERQGPGFATTGPVGYRDARASYRRMRRYWPGRYTLTLLGRRLGGASTAPDHPDPSDRSSQRRQAELFVNVLSRSPVDLSSLQLIVFELNAYNRHHGLFEPALREVIEAGSYPPFIENMFVLELASELGPELWYRLDDHLNAAGHEVVARRLWEIIEPSLPNDG